MLRPLQDKVILQIKKEGEITKGGIILRNHSNDKALLAKVIAVGPGAMSQGIRMIMEVKEGDIVYVAKEVGISMEYEGEEYIVVTQNDILAVMR